MCLICPVPDPPLNVEPVLLHVSCSVKSIRGSRAFGVQGPGPSADALGRCELDDFEQDIDLNLRP